MFVSRVLPYLLIASLALVSACSSKDREPDTVSETEVYERAQNQLNRNQWEQAIRSLQLLEEHFPFGVYAEQAQLELIYAYYRSNMMDSVHSAANRFIRLHPQHRNADYAYYMMGMASFTEGRGMFERVLPTDLSLRDPGAARESLAHFSQLLARYPDSVYAADAKQRMLHLRNLLARSEIHVANYYFKRGAYMAATNRGRHVLENYSQSPAVPDALAVMVQGYRLMGMEDLSQQSLRVLRENFPDHPALNAAGEFDFQYAGAGERSWISRLTFGLFDKREPEGFDSRELYDPEYMRDDLRPRPQS
ncbi:outer membrane protein assembly factor BamD [Marinimicrobium alkaliphilum]|uniref:outer membrane protein assembly factor BamD n=1 Tax=Marinimicrobium alkaliphilum TaxID=2202654 RepID=UPI000DB92B71|nr:outer membrane protein assembly factor BamD [Marinimicrobium alkaliphilum]